MKDELGLALSGATPDAFAHYRRALRGLQTFTGDPVGAVNDAIEVAPHFVMAHLLKGWLYGLSTEAAAMPVARAAFETAAKLPATPREAGHVAALGALVSGGWHEAGRLLAEVSRDNPRDALALQAGHQIDFFTGNAPMLRDRIATALPAWDAAMPGFHALLSAHAFGLEENGDYAAAERQGRRAVELEPLDGWGQHAVAHVMEMQCRQRDGIAWMRNNEAQWAGDSFLKVHNWWHLALFHYELGEIDAVLSLHDDHIVAGGGAVVLNLVDASALLWRLHLGGHEVGNRWAELAERWAPYAECGNYAFNDAHAMMAFVGGNRPDLAARLEGALEAASEAGGDNAGFTRDVGRPAAAAIRAFGEGDFRRAVALLEPILARAHRFGGSHAQRDVLELTVMEAAMRGGDRERSAVLARRRAAARPNSPLSALFVARVHALD